MAQQKTFRTALNGFNREDVVHYIEYMNAKHLSEINQLNSEIEFLRGKLAEQPQPAERAEGEAQPQCEELEEKLCAALGEKYQAETERDAALAAKAQAEAERDAALVDKAQAEAQRDAALAQKAQAETEKTAAVAQQSTVQCRIEQELEAYRRAERAERMAKERAEKVYHQVNGVLADAAVKVDDAASQIGTLTDQVLAQLTQLQGAVAGSKQALADAAETMYTIRPTGEEE